MLVQPSVLISSYPLNADYLVYMSLYSSTIVTGFYSLCLYSGKENNNCLEEQWHHLILNMQKPFHFNALHRFVLMSVATAGNSQVRVAYTDPLKQLFSPEMILCQLQK